MYVDRACKSRYFLNEDPWGAKSWHPDEVKRIAAIRGVKVVRSEECPYDQVSSLTAQG